MYILYFHRSEIRYGGCALKGLEMAFSSTAFFYRSV